MCTFVNSELSYLACLLAEKNAVQRRGRFFPHDSLQPVEDFCLVEVSRTQKLVLFNSR